MKIANAREPAVKDTVIAANAKPFTVILKKCSASANGLKLQAFQNPCQEPA